MTAYCNSFGLCPGQALSNLLQLESHQREEERGKERGEKGGVGVGELERKGAKDDRSNHKITIFHTMLK